MSASRVTGETWKTLPMRNPTSIPLQLNASGSDFEKLLQGFQPEEMEDRWMCRADGPDAQGHAVVHFYRSWTGREHFQIKATASASNTDAAQRRQGQGARITELVWDKSDEATESWEEDAKDLAMNVCQVLLGCEMK